jgi:hypothetical protein
MYYWYSLFVLIRFPKFWLWLRFGLVICLCFLCMCFLAQAFLEISNIRRWTSSSFQSSLIVTWSSTTLCLTDLLANRSLRALRAVRLSRTRNVVVPRTFRSSTQANLEENPAVLLVFTALGLTAAQPPALFPRRQLRPRRPSRRTRQQLQLRPTLPQLLNLRLKLPRSPRSRRLQAPV